MQAAGCTDKGTQITRVRKQNMYIITGGKLRQFGIKVISSGKVHTSRVLYSCTCNQQAEKWSALWHFAAYCAPTM